MIDLLDDLLNLSPEDKEKQRLREEQRRKEIKRKIEEAVKMENIELSTREYNKIIEGDKSRQSIIIFINTKKGIYDEPDTLGRIMFTLYENTNIKEVFIRSKLEGRDVSYFMKKFLHFDIIAIYSRYRGYGLSKQLALYFFKLYEKKYKDYPITVEFVNHIAEDMMKKVIASKGINNPFNEKLIQRYYE